MKMFFEFLIYNPLRNLLSLAVLLIGIGIMAFFGFNLTSVLIFSGLTIAAIVGIQANIASEVGYKTKNQHKTVDWKWF